MTPETQARIDTIARYAAPDGDKVRIVRYEPDPEDETVEVDPWAFWHGFGVAALLCSIFWLSVLYAVVSR